MEGKEHIKIYSIKVNSKELSHKNVVLVVISTLEKQRWCNYFLFKVSFGCGGKG